MADKRSLVDRSAGPPPKVIIVDEAIAVGGSFIVAAQLLRGLGAKSGSLIVGDIPVESVTAYVSPDAYRRIRRPFNYSVRDKWMQRSRLIPGRLTQKLTRYLILFIGEIVNIPSNIRMRTLFKKEEPDLIHVNNSDDATNIARALGLPVVRHLHGLVNYSPDSRAAKKFRRTDQFIAISKCVARSAVESGVPESSIELVPNPAEQQIEDAKLTRSLRESWQAGNGRYVVIGMVGRLVPWKGQIKLLRALTRIADDSVPWKLVFIGSDDEFGGGYAESLKQFVRDNLPQDRVLFLGFMSNVSAAFFAVDIVVHCSIEPEPFGLVITEAMAHRRPIIASTRGAGPEIVTDNVDGLLVDPDDTDELARALGKLITDPGLREKLSGNGIKTIQQRYTMEKFLSRMNSVHQRALGEK